MGEDLRGLTRLVSRMQRKIVAQQTRAGALQNLDGNYFSMRRSLVRYRRMRRIGR